VSSGDSAGSELVDDRLQFGAVAMWHYPATSRGCFLAFRLLSWPSTQWRSS
jgi:hypothetical protein